MATGSRTRPCRPIAHASACSPRSTTLPTKIPPPSSKTIAKSERSGDASKRKIADLYNSYMDEKGIEAKGVEPLQPHLKTIAEIRTRRSWRTRWAQTLRADVDALNNTNFHTNHLVWNVGGAVASTIPITTRAYLLQGGVQLPDREYYLSDSEHMKEVRTKYQAHVSAMLKLAGFDGHRCTRRKDHRVGDTPSREKHLSLADNDDIHKANNAWKQADFQQERSWPGLGGILPRRRPDASSPASSCGSRRRSPASRRWSPRTSSIPGRTGWRIT